MVYIFTLLFLEFLIAFGVILLKSTLVLSIESANRKKVLGILGAGALLSLLLTVVTIPSSQKVITSSDLSLGISVGPATPIPTQTITPSPFPISTPTLIPRVRGTLVKVVNVVDGDTIKIETGETVRYIGIDTPETVHPAKPIQCYGKEASDKNTELVEGKVVELEKDISELDKYGRLLRYVWLDDMLINEILVREGYAQSSTYPPDVKYQDRIIEAQRFAREEHRGLWGSACANTPILKPSSRPTAKQSGSTTSEGGLQSGSFSCNCNKTCPQMSSCAEAQYQLNICGCSARDADDDGIACDSDCQ